MTVSGCRADGEDRMAMAAIFAFYLAAARRLGANVVFQSDLGGAGAGATVRSRECSEAPASFPLAGDRRLVR